MDPISHRGQSLGGATSNHLLAVLVRQIDLEVRILDPRWGESSGADHELFVLPFQHNTGVILSALILYHSSNEFPFLVFEGLLHFTLGGDEMAIVFLLDDGEVRPAIKVSCMPRRSVTGAYHILQTRVTIGKCGGRSLLACHLYPTSANLQGLAMSQMWKWAKTYDGPQDITGLPCRPSALLFLTVFHSFPASRRVMSSLSAASHSSKLRGITRAFVAFLPDWRFRFFGAGSSKGELKGIRVGAVVGDVSAACFVFDPKCSPVLVTPKVEKRFRLLVVVGSAAERPGRTTGVSGCESRSDVTSVGVAEGPAAMFCFASAMKLLVTFAGVFPKACSSSGPAKNIMPAVGSSGSAKESDILSYRGFSGWKWMVMVSGKAGVWRRSLI